MGETESRVTNGLLANAACAYLSHGGPDSGPQVFPKAFVCGLGGEGTGGSQCWSKDTSGQPNLWVWLKVRQEPAWFGKTLSPHSTTLVGVQGSILSLGDKQRCAEFMGWFTDTPCLTPLPAFLSFRAEQEILTLHSLQQIDISLTFAGTGAQKPGVQRVLRQKGRHTHPLT